MSYRWAVGGGGLGFLKFSELRTQGSCRAAGDFRPHVECVMLILSQTPMNMKTSHSSRSRRGARSGPWHAKNIRLLRAALRVWELKQRAAGR